MRRRTLWLALLIVGACPAVALAQPSNFDSSLHMTRAGKNTWYGWENGGFETWTGIPIEDLGCNGCHGPTDADGNPYPAEYTPSCSDCHQAFPGGPVEESQCYSCHGRQKTESQTLGYTDVHTDLVDDDGIPDNDPLTCWDCHDTGDLHGDGIQYVSMLEPTAINVDCVDCHTSLPAGHAAHDPHNEALHCKACHTRSVVSCYNCHFESLTEGHQKRARQPIHDFVMLVNRHEDGKVHPATFQSVYSDDAEAGFTAFAPYTAHTITSTGRACDECHNSAGSNETIEEYNTTGLIRFAEWDDGTNTLAWNHGIVPMPENYLKRFKMDFITYTGHPSDPTGPSPLWDAVGKDVWDGQQMFYADPLTRDQMRALGFADDIFVDIRPGICPNLLNQSASGTLPVVIPGTLSFDVLDIDVSTLLLSGVPPSSFSYADVTGPASGDLCDCVEEVSDGFMDLVLEFPNQSIGTAIGPAAGGDTKMLAMTGALIDTTPIVGNDCVEVSCLSDVTGPDGIGVPDGNIDALDYLLIIAEWGNPCNGACATDVTGPTGEPDGIVDALDFLVMLSMWGTPGNCP
jgi:hypothetical protein